MAKFDVSLEDGRTVSVYADDEAAALKHAKYAESSRVSSDRNSAKMKGQREEPDFAPPVKAVKVKD